MDHILLKFQLFCRYRHEVACFENRIYVFGGGTSQLVHSLNEIYVYYVDENLWKLQVTKPDQILNSKIVLYVMSLILLKTQTAVNALYSYLYAYKT